MPDIAYFPPEDLVHDLAMSLWRSHGALRDLARRKAWEPSIDDCRRIAERQVEQLKRHGVFQVSRTIAAAHGRVHAGPRSRRRPCRSGGAARGPGAERCAAAIPTF